jgi:hypothetical protein
MPPNIIIKGHTQFDDVTDPYYLAKIIPGFAAKMDGIKELRENIEVQSADLKYTLSLPYEVWMILAGVFQDPRELHEHIIPRIAELHPEYKVQK